MNALQLLRTQVRRLVSLSQAANSSVQTHEQTHKMTVLMPVHCWKRVAVRATKS